MKKILSLVSIAIFALMLFSSCSEETTEALNSAKATWKIGKAGTITYSNKPIPISEKYLNQIIGYYAGNTLDTTSTKEFSMEFREGGSIYVDGSALSGSSWSQTGSDVSFNIGPELKFTGTVYVTYMSATAENIKVDMLPESIKIILGLLIKDLDNYTTLDKMWVYLSKE